jgi:glycosyltransferase involved in cell wall biosynthesis
MNINVLYIIQCLGIGGTEKQLVELIRGLKNSQFTPHLCTLIPSEGLIKELSIPKIQLHFRSFLDPSLLSNLARLSAFIRRHEIHLVQAFFQDPFLLSAFLKPWHQFKLIGSFRDLGFWRTPTEVCKMRMAYRFFDGFIANSQAVKDYIVNVDRLPAGRMEVIRNGIYVDGTQTSATGGPPLVGIVANCNRAVKRVQDFIHAAALVHRAHPEVRFAIVGDGPLRQDLERLSCGLGIGDVLKFTGRLSDPLDLVRGFSVGVITSETEGFCNAILEYMACGVPVVAASTGGNPELVRDGENGFLVPVGDVRQMARRISQLLEEDAMREHMRVANLARVAEEFSISRMVSEHQSFYRKILLN